MTTATLAPRLFGDYRQTVLALLLLHPEQAYHVDHSGDVIIAAVPDQCLVQAEALLRRARTLSGANTNASA